MMRIILLPPRGVTIPEDSPWVALINGLRFAGHDVVGFGDNGQPADALVVLNHQADTGRIQSDRRVHPENSILIALEPRITAPAMYRKQALNLYGKKFAASPIWAKRIQGSSFPWPQELRQPIARMQTNKFAASLINGDKRSAVKGSLYGLRRSVIRAFNEKSIPLAIFGPGWGDSSVRRLKQAVKAVTKCSITGLPPDLSEAFSDLNLYPANWMGTVAEKADAFSVAPTSIVIENSADYVSEKLVDAVCAGVVPLYVGPPLRKFGFPSEIAIECEPSAESIITALQGLNHNRRAEVSAAGQQWLSSDESRKHDIQFVLSDLGRKIGDGLNMKQ